MITFNVLTQGIISLGIRTLSIINLLKIIMKNLKTIVLTSIIVIGICFIGYSLKTNNTGGAYTYQNCNVTVTDTVVVGDDLSATLLSATSGRTWARIELEAFEQDNVYLMFGETATINDGLLLSSTTAQYIDIGYSTDIPYTGIITGITDGTASSTLLITECR